MHVHSPSYTYNPYLFERMEKIRKELENVITKQTSLHDPHVVKLSRELDNLVLQFYKSKSKA